MHPALVITLAAAAALPLGLWLRYDLNRLGYRTANERDLPHPGPRWWVVWSSVLAAAGICAAAAASGDPLRFLSLSPLLISGPWLAAVDFDVMRVPNRVLGPTAFLTLLAVLGVAASRQDWRSAFLPVIASVVTGGLFASVHFYTHGGIGFGDVKLAALIGLAVASLGPASIWITVLTGSAVAVTWAAATRRIGPLPYGPWLLLGTWIGAMTTGTGT